MTDSAPEILSRLEVIAQASLYDPNIYRIISRITSTLKDHYIPVIIGSYIRNRLLQELTTFSRVPRDLDIIVIGSSSDQALQNCFAGENVKKTAFGGIKIKYENISIDVWRAEMQAKSTGSDFPVLDTQQLMSHITLSIDAIGYDLTTNKLIDGGFVKSALSRIIDSGPLVKWPKNVAHLHLAHTAYSRTITGFSLSKQLADIVAANSDPDTIHKAADYLASRNKIPYPLSAVKLTVYESKL